LAPRLRPSAGLSESGAGLGNFQATLFRDVPVTGPFRRRTLSFGATAPHSLWSMILLKGAGMGFSGGLLPYRQRRSLQRSWPQREPPGSTRTHSTPSDTIPRLCPTAVTHFMESCLLTYVVANFEVLVYVLYFYSNFLIHPWFTSEKKAERDF